MCIRTCGSVRLYDCTICPQPENYAFSVKINQCEDLLNHNFAVVCVCIYVKSPTAQADLTNYWSCLTISAGRSEELYAFPVRRPAQEDLRTYLTVKASAGRSEELPLLSPGRSEDLNLDCKGQRRKI